MLTVTDCAVVAETYGNMIRNRLFLDEAKQEKQNICFIQPKDRFSNVGNLEISLTQQLP